MDSHWGTDHRKRRRRRNPEKPAAPALLFFDSRLQSDTALLSPDLFDELFPAIGSAKEREKENGQDTSVDAHYIAIAPAAAAPGPASVEQRAWTLLAAKKAADIQQTGSTRATIHVASSSTSIQSLVRALQKAAENKPLANIRNGIEVLVLDIAPVNLESVVVSVDLNAVARWKSGEQRKGNDAVDAAIRSALASARVVHGGDLLPLDPSNSNRSLPVHVELCDPVAQGLVSSKTRIVVLDSSQAKATTKRPAITNGVSEEDEDSSEFFSAAEDGPKARALGSDNDDDLSGDDDDTIGLSLPMLPTPASGVLSAFSAMTPRAGYSGTGFASPGSVISTFSTSTVRGLASKGRLFDARGLYKRVDDDVLTPKPAPDEDDEARVFIDAASLAKIGCFSGDWVRVEAAPADSLANFSLASLAPDAAQPEWRVARVYAPLGAPPRPRYALERFPQRRLSVSMSSFKKPALNVHMSPILLSNLGSPSSVRVASLLPRRGMKAPKLRANPPLAREVTFMKLMTPAATEKPLDSTMFAAIRKYFESKHRLVKSGDLLAIPIDGELGKAMYQASPDEDAEQDELVSRNPSDEADTQIAWFKIGAVTVEQAEDDDDDISWGGLALVKPGTTRMAQAGTAKGKLPDAHSAWPYYLEARRLPPSDAGLYPAPPPSVVSPLRRRLRELISAATSPQAVHLGLPPLAVLLYSAQRHIGKATVVANACLDLGHHVFSIDANDIIAEGGGGGGDVKTAAVLEARSERGLTCGPDVTTLLVRHIEALTAERMASSMAQIVEKCRVLVATTTNLEAVPDGIRSLFTHEIEVSAPDEGERQGLLQDIVHTAGISLAADVDLSAVALKTAALVAGDLQDVVDRAVIARRDRLERLADANRDTSALKATVRDVQLAGGSAARAVGRADFDAAVEAARKNFADSIGAPKIPNVSWDDVGGLANVKDAVMETIQLPLERPELFAKGMKKRSGILFYGPPGTGKTLLAKAIATEFSLNFFSVKGPELLNMYIGESEANVRRVFQRARDARPCVVFFDELDSVAPKRGKSGDSQGVMDRIVSQLLAELDGMSSSDGAGGGGGGGGVFVIGATNRPDLLDEALLRPGRFDKMLYLGVSDTHQKQQTILEALTRKFKLAPALSLADVAATLPFTYTGADLYALCSDAMLKAVTRLSRHVDAQVRAINAQRAAAPGKPQPPVSVGHYFDHLAKLADLEVIVERDDFAAARAELVPSISAKELRHYESIRDAIEQSKDAKGPGTNGDDARLRPRPDSRRESIASTNGSASIYSQANGRDSRDSARETRDSKTDRDPRDKGKGKQRATSGPAPPRDSVYRFHDGPAGAGSYGQAGFPPAHRFRNAAADDDEALYDAK